MKVLSVILQTILFGAGWFVLSAWPKANPSFSTSEFLHRIVKPTRLIDEAAQPCWSPDGNRIAYSYMSNGEDRENGGGIMILTIGKRKPARITADGKDPAWSPDGKWMAFVRAGYDDTVESIWLIPSTGGQSPRYIAEGGYPQWMPDSRTIIYHSRQTNGVCQVTLKDGIPREKKRLFGLSCWYPRLSPDGNEIAYILPSLTSFLFHKNNGDRDYVLVISDLKKNLFGHRTIPYDSFLAGWSPDGDWIAFGGINQPVGLQIIKADLSSPPQTILEGTWSRPAWSPDGHYIAYDTMKDGELEVWVLSCSEIELK